METYTKPTFTEKEIQKFENVIDNQISKGNQQICLSTNIISDEMQRFQLYLGFHYLTGTFSQNPNVRNYRIAKNGKKYTKTENW